MTNGARHGVRLVAFASMIAASALGLGLLLSVSAAAFTVFKVIGAAYLVYLGERLIRGRRTPPSTPER